MAKVQTSMGNVTVMDKIIKMFDDQDHCDVTFDVQGRRFQAHKLVLLAHSFKLVDKDTEKLVIKVEEIDYETFHTIIRFFYVEKIKLNKLNVFKLMHASHSLEISELADQCAEYLGRKVFVDNFAHMMNASLCFQNTRLKNFLMNYFGLNQRRIINQISFKHLSQESVVELLPAIATNASDLELFVMFRRWARAECERKGVKMASGQDIRNAFGEHFRKLRLPFLQMEDVARLIISKDILTKDEELSFLYVMTLPNYLRVNAVVENFPFDSKPIFSKVPNDSKKDETSLITKTVKCGLCEAELDQCYGSEMVHCTECEFDICMKCCIEHQDHRSSLCMKTVYGQTKDCCKSCGWPVHTFDEGGLSSTEESKLQAHSSSGVQIAPPGSLTNYGAATGKSTSIFGTTNPVKRAFVSSGGLFGPSPFSSSQTVSSGFYFGTPVAKNNSAVGPFAANAALKQEVKSAMDGTVTDIKDKADSDHEDLCENCNQPLKNGTTEKKEETE